MNSWRREKSHSPAMRVCIGDASPTIFPRNFFFHLSDEAFNQDEWNAEISSKCQAYLCVCVRSKAFPNAYNQLCPFNNTPATFFFSCMYKLIQLHAPKIQVEGCDVDEILDPLKNVYTRKKSTKSINSNENILSFLSLSIYIKKYSENLYSTRYF